METKKSKTGGIIGTLAAVLLCGCPGLFFCIIGSVTALGKMPYDFDFNGQTSSGMLSASWGYAFLCLSIFMILIPIIVGIFTLRNKKPKVVDTNETLPPTA